MFSDCVVNGLPDDMIFLHFETVFCMSIMSHEGLLSKLYAHEIDRNILACIDMMMGSNSVRSESSDVF